MNLQFYSEVVTKKVKANGDEEVEVPVRRTYASVTNEKGEEVVEFVDQHSGDPDDRFIGQQQAFKNLVAHFSGDENKSFRKEMWNRFRTRSRRSQKFYGVSRDMAGNE